MLTLYHAPFSRASRFIALLEELGAREAVTVETVGVARHDGSGGPDPRNPHPEGKVPLLVHDGVEIRESSAIALYLTDLFADGRMGRPVGAPDRGRLLSWLAWYGGVLEPVVVADFAGLDHPVLRATFRGVPEAVARLAEALDRGPYLMGEDYSVADLLVASTFQFAPHLVPETGPIADWVRRCSGRPAQRHAADFDASFTAAA